VDPELLWVAAMLHDFGLVEPHDAHFKLYGAAEARKFAIEETGWDDKRAIFCTKQLSLTLQSKQS